MSKEAKSDFAYMQKNYFTQPNYLKVNGAPIVLIFGPITFKTSAEWDTILKDIFPKPKILPLFGNTNMVGKHNVAGEYPWIYEPNSKDNVVERYYSQYFKSREDASSISLGIVYPGFKTFYQAGGWGGPTWQIDYNGTSPFATMLDKALTSNVGIIQFATWNDYGEGTAIEPTFEFGYKFLTIMQKKLGVSYRQHELEQIYRLYQLRKESKNNRDVQNQLEQVFTYFANQQTEKVESLMDKIAQGGTTPNFKFLEGLYKREKASPSVTTFAIKNRWLNQFLYEENWQVKYGPSNKDAISKWMLEEYNGHTRIKNLSTGHYLNIEHLYSYAECAIIPTSHYSSYWVVEDYNGFKRLKSEWQGTYLNVENKTGFVQCTKVPNDFVSSHWILE